MTVNVNGVELYVEKTGQGPPLVMVHGNGEDHGIFREAAAVLGACHTCYCPDSRGHGASTPVTELHYEDMAADAVALMETFMEARDWMSPASRWEKNSIGSRRTFHMYVVEPMTAILPLILRE